MTPQCVSAHKVAGSDHLPQRRSCVRGRLVRHQSSKLNNAVRFRTDAPSIPHHRLTPHAQPGEGNASALNGEIPDSTVHADPWFPIAAIEQSPRVFAARHSPNYRRSRLYSLPITGETAGFLGHHFDDTPVAVRLSVAGGDCWNRGVVESLSPRPPRVSENAGHDFIQPLHVASQRIKPGGNRASASTLNLKTLASRPQNYAWSLSRCANTLSNSEKRHSR